MGQPRNKWPPCPLAAEIEGVGGQVAVGGDEDDGDEGEGGEEEDETETT